MADGQDVNVTFFRELIQRDITGAPEGYRQFPQLLAIVLYFSASVGIDQSRNCADNRIERAFRGFDVPVKQEVEEPIEVRPRFCIVADLRLIGSTRLSSFRAWPGVQREPLRRGTRHRCVLLPQEGPNLVP